MSSVNEEVCQELPPLEFRSRAFDGCFSPESLLGSIVLHLAALFLVVVLAVDRSDFHHDAIVVDIGNITLPDQRRPAAPPQASAEEARQSETVAATETELAPRAVQVPAAVPPVADEQKVEPAGDADPAPSPDPAAESVAPTPVFPEPSIPHQHGEYDPFEVYKALVAQRVRDVTASSRDLPARTLFTGKMAIHLYLDPSGRHLQSPKICLGHSEIYLAAALPQQAAQQHFNLLVREVVGAVIRGAPYPNVPPGLEIPREMTYFIELGPEQRPGPAG